MTHEFDLNKPAHHIANDVLRKLEQIAHDSGVEIAFGVKSHNVIAHLVQQYQEALENERALNHHLTNDVERLQQELAEANSKSRDNMRADALKQEQDEIAQEAWLRDRLKALRFPAVEDVYVADSYYFYVTFARLLTQFEVMQAHGAINATIERTPVACNRYRVVFERLDKEED